MIMFVQDGFNFNKARDICMMQLQDFACVQLVYGKAGW